MNFNDLTFRLQRIYAAIDKSCDSDIQAYVLVEKSAPNQFQITFNKGEKECDVANAAMTIIHNLAFLKDHLIDLHNKEEIESDINDCLPLQLVLDLSNNDKHPHLDQEWSGKSPKIQNIRSELVIPPQKQFGINVTKGKVIEADGCYVTITAEILDGEGVLLNRFTDLTTKAMDAWEAMIKKYKIA